MLHFTQFLILTLLLSCAQLIAEDKIITDQFARISPEQAGYDSEVLEKLTQHLEQSGSSSMLLIHDGQVFYEWGDIYKTHLIHSVRKSLLSGLMGILYDQNKLPLDKSLAALNADDAPMKLTEQEKQATVAMILKSRSGIYTPSTAESYGMTAGKPERGSYKPDEHYYYNNWDFNYAGHLFELISKQSIFDAFDKYFAKPLGMQQFNNKQTRIDLPFDGPLPDADAIYQYELSKSLYPAYHFRMSTHDLALYGQLYMNHGEWQGKQLLSKEWIDLATKAYSVTDPKYDLGYGMMWKVVINDPDDTSRNSFYHTGLGVHMLGVYPKHKLVMVHRVDTEADEVTFRNRDLYPVIRMMHQARKQK